MSNRKQFLFAMVLGSGAAAVAQSPLSTAPMHVGDERVPIHTAAADRGVDYGLWAAGAGYKASFHAGPTFVPYLGRDYPDRIGLGWSTQSACVGDAPLCTDVPRLRYGAFRAEYDHGGVIEAYDVRTDGLEQTFVLARRPAAVGDLVIRGRVETTLAAATRAAVHGAVDFVDADGRPVVRYGAAVAVDARGVRTPMTTRVDGETIELRLGAESLAAAEFPLVVDPLLANVYANSSGQEVGEIDLIHDSQAAGGQIWLVAERWASATDADLRLRRVDNGGGGATLVWTDITANWSSTGPSLGLHRYAQRTLLAFARHFFVDGKRLVRVHTHDRADFVLSTSFAPVWTGDFNAWRPDVSTDYAAGAPSTLLVVFQREGDLAFANSGTSIVQGTIVDVDTGTTGTPFDIEATPGEDHERPVVAKVRAGGSGAFGVAYQTIGAGGGAHIDWDVQMRRVDRNAVVSAATEISLVSGHDMAPHIAGENGDLLLVWVRSSAAVAGAKPLGDVGQTLVAYRVQWNGAGYTTLLPGQQLEHNVDPRIVVTGFDRNRDTQSHYAVTYRSTATENAYLDVLGFDGASLGQHLLFDAAGNDASSGGAVAYDEDNEQFLLGYAYNIPGLGLEYVRPFVHPSAPAITSSGSACGTGNLDWIGSQLIGDGSVSVRLQNAPVGAIATVLFATSTASLQLFGVAPIVDGCWLLVPNAGPDFLGWVPPQLGPNPVWTFGLPSALTSVTLRLQGVHFDAGNTQVFTTERLNVPLVK